MLNHETVTRYANNFFAAYCVFGIRLIRDVPYIATSLVLIVAFHALMRLYPLTISEARDHPDQDPGA